MLAASAERLSDSGELDEDGEDDGEDYEMDDEDANADDVEDDGEGSDFDVKRRRGSSRIQRAPVTLHGPQKQRLRVVQQQQYDWWHR